MKETFVALMFWLTRDLFNRRRGGQEPRDGHEPRRAGNEPRIGERRRIGIRESQTKMQDSIDRLSTTLGMRKHD